ncbi:hypothetical protein Xmau_01435 [Xenorhabdus mauleonii]|uniref:Pilus assembly protein HofO n=1 Tax=Xenorhabdus mauleonii TaxID=351675 RepID=A0A1I3PQD2_9GAMM|nr:hypothetical protein [Xenorhabdus mauleonii]PHM44723.1 hypothetical protein Xmau_01435 [Xenorhabdus mauleonii]SFJ23693.1 pilus assembly protein HofO [Xenorhabdus mauleonii]
MGNNYLEWFHRPVWQQFFAQQLIIVLLLAGFYCFVWQERQHEIHAIQSRIAEQQDNVALSQQRITELPSMPDIRQKIQQITAILSQGSLISTQKSPTETQTTKNTSILKRLHQPLAYSGSQLMEWKTYRENNHTFWHIILSMNYGQFLHFLNEIQRLQPPLLIKHLTITPSEITPNDEKLIVRMALSEADESNIDPSGIPSSDSALPAANPPANSLHGGRP